MSEKRTKADKAQREADLLDKKSSHRPPQNQEKAPCGKSKRLLRSINHRPGQPTRPTVLRKALFRCAQRPWSQSKIAIYLAAYNFRGIDSFSRFAHLSVMS